MGGEDCLFLNVYVPAGGSNNKTVLVWIHGGGFNSEDATDISFGPDFLLSQDNIVVTIEYRLGIFGFLNLNFGEYTGNMGLKDQQLALRWIHENIEHFSGNKNEVLLFGQSAGAVSVHLQMLNKESRKYFQRAFAASGSPYQSYVFPKANHVKVIQECFKIKETDKLIGYLKAENTTTLLSPPCNPLEDFTLLWVPIIESNNTKDAFLTKTPEELYNDPNEDAPALDAMFSFTSQESTFSMMNVSSFDGSEPVIKENVMDISKELEIISEELTKKLSPKEYEQALRKLRRAYFSNVTTIDAIKRANNDLLSDSGMNYPIMKGAAHQSDANTKATKRKNTFLFRFNVTSDFNVGSLSYESLTDATHSDDICYMFYCHDLDQIKKYEKHLESKNSNYDLIMRSVKMITNFARTGDPSIEGDTPFKSINSIDEMYCQEVADELKTSMTHDIRQQKHYDVWHEIHEAAKNHNL